jgi:hypothetical protein
MSWCGGDKREEPGNGDLAGGTRTRMKLEETWTRTLQWKKN